MGAKHLRKWRAGLSATHRMRTEVAWIRSRTSFEVSYTATIDKESKLDWLEASSSLAMIVHGNPRSSRMSSASIVRRVLVALPN